MAGVNNPTNFKPLFDMQGQAIVDEIQNSQSAINFTVSTSGDAVLNEISNLRADNTNRINGARDALNGYMSSYRNQTREQIETFELATGQALTGLAAEVEVLKAELQTIPKSPIKSVQRGAESFNTSSSAIINIASVDLSKALLVLSSTKGGGARMNTSSSIYITKPVDSTLFWEVIEYV
jgi:hypothetical protein